MTTTTAELLPLPKPIAGLVRAREAVRQRWAKEAVNGLVSWSPDVVDVRSVDIDKTARFAQDMQGLMVMARTFRRGSPDLAYMAVFAQTLVDKIERLTATHFRE